MFWALTGDPLAYPKTLQGNWGREPGLPRLPFFSSDGVTSLWLNLLAVWLGLGCGGVCLGLLVRWVRARRGRAESAPALSPAVVFSLAYCCCVALVTIFVFRSDVANSARYIFATPFFVVLLGHVARMAPWPPRTYWLIGTVAVTTVAALGFPQVPGFAVGEALWYVGLTVAYGVVTVGSRQWRWGADALLLLYAFNLLMQFHLLDSFLTVLLGRMTCLPTLLPTGTPVLLARKFAL